MTTSKRTGGQTSDTAPPKTTTKPEPTAGDFEVLLEKWSVLKQKMPDFVTIDVLYSPIRFGKGWCLSALNGNATIVSLESDNPLGDWEQFETLLADHGLLNDDETSSLQSTLLQAQLVARSKSSDANQVWLSVVERKQSDDSIKAVFVAEVSTYTGQRYGAAEDVDWRAAIAKCLASVG